jgi:hypothetical protein
MSAWLEDAPLHLQLFKQYMVDATGLGKDALHVYAGLILFIGVRLIWRRRGGWVLGWLAALAAALIVEWLDIRTEIAEANLRPDAEHWKDIWNTMFWPTVLLLVGPWLQPRPKAAEEARSGDLADNALHNPGKQPPPV